jgi:hypothetical protein
MPHTNRYNQTESASFRGKENQEMIFFTEKAPKLSFFALCVFQLSKAVGGRRGGLVPLCVAIEFKGSVK